MRRIIIWASLAALLITLLGCGHVSQSMELAVCGSYGVPGMMCFDLKGDSYTCEIKETDSFGRILFAYMAYNQLKQEKAMFWVICQRTSADSVFFYEDICYMPATEDVSCLGALKTRNDWEQPLDMEKATERPINISFDLFLQSGTKLDATTVKETFCRMADLKDSVIQDFGLIDENRAGQALYIALAGEKKYLVLSNENYDLKWAALHEASAYEEQAVAFKQQNEWIYSK